VQTYLAGQNITVAVPLTRGGEPVVADGSTISWSLRGHDGAELSAAATLACSDSTALIPVPAGSNGLASAWSEKRTILVTFNVAGQPQTARVAYRLTNFLNHSVEPAEIRTFIGITEGELPDAEIDLSAAYLDVAGATDFADLAQALAGEAASEQAANRGIIAQAVINLLPGLPARISKSESDGTSKVERFPIDLAQLEARARAQLASAIATFTSVTNTDPVFIAFSSRTDPLTGA
jgi:hypothetical protein